jgi:uncharacterized protein
LKIENEINAGIACLDRTNEVEPRPNGACNKDECLLDANTKAKCLIDMFDKFGLYNIDFFPLISPYNCMARSINSYLISYDGKLYKCWNDIGIEKKAVGSIYSKGLNINLFARYLKAADKMDDYECNNCFMFPICNGGCPYLRIENIYNNAEYDYCHIAKKDLKRFLEIHYTMRQYFRNKYPNTK